MGEVRAEAEPALELLREWGGLRFAYLLHGTATLANEVLMQPGGSDVVDAGCVSEVCVTEDPDLLERRKRAVHRRRAHCRKLAAHPRDDLLGGCVAFRGGDCFECGLALRRPAQSV